MRRHLSARVRHAPRSLYPGVLQPRRAEVVRDAAEDDGSKRSAGGRRTEGPLTPRREGA